MSLKSLEYFLAAAEELNITEAAGKLYITQQTLSGHIKRLEEQYHVQLFTRKPRMALTAEGACMVKYARHLLQLERTMSSELAQLNRDAEGTISLGISRMRAKYCYPSIWDHYRTSHPNIKIQMNHSDSEILERQLESHAIDMCVVINAAASDYIASETLLEENIYAVVNREQFKERFGPDHKKLLEEYVWGITPEKLSDLPVMYPKRNRMQRLIESCFDAHTVVPNAVLQSNEQELLFQMAAVGRGVAYISPLCIFVRGSDLGEMLRKVYVFPVTDMRVRTKLLYQREEEIPEYKKDFIFTCKSVFGEISDCLDGMYEASRRLQLRNP